MRENREKLDEKVPSSHEEQDESPDQQLDSNLETIENLRKEKEEIEDLLLRKQAEFENYRKRVIKEREEHRLAAQGEVFEQLLPTLDALEKGLHSLKESPGNSELATYRQGYEMILQEIQSLLHKFRVTEIPGLGENFDPNVHEAVLREVTSDHEDGKILDELRKGYKIRHRLLRPSQVKVAVHPDDLSVTPEGEEE
ncbi:nucleotide exchange factor GrpE [Acidobacteria bacterium AH-259-D05]|nr:nucleotide exchange factor GrpE [Acidobacteria bacterium AH-259-D05]